MKEKIITIQLEYIFDCSWASAIHRPGVTRIYPAVTHSSFDRIMNLKPKTRSGTLDGDFHQFNF